MNLYHKDIQTVCTWCFLAKTSCLHAFTPQSCILISIWQNTKMFQFLASFHFCASGKKRNLHVSLGVCVCVFSCPQSYSSVVVHWWTHTSLSSVQSEYLVKLKSWVFTEEGGKKTDNKNSLSVSCPLRTPVCLSGRDTNRSCAVGVLAAMTCGCPWPCPLLILLTVSLCSQIYVDLFFFWPLFWDACMCKTTILGRKGLRFVGDASCVQFDGQNNVYILYKYKTTCLLITLLIAY